MALLLDLDDQVHDPHADPNEPAAFVLRKRHRSDHSDGPTTPKYLKRPEDPNLPPRPNPNLNGLSAAVACYPIVTQIVHNIDLNTLHALARTCRQLRANLLQYRSFLVQSTLRCVNERYTEQLAALRPAGQTWHILGEAGHLVSGKVSTCARDRVGECRKCGTVVCRNCTLKPPPPSHLPARHRRLCPVCLAAPLAATDSSCHTACACATEIHLCNPCGLSLSREDTSYRRIWTWRTRYSTCLGGLGTGIGEGHEGVKCARGDKCLGAKDVEVEFECSTTSSSSSSAAGTSESESGGEGGGGGGGGGEKKSEEDAGYWRQEIEGLGGIVKKKYRKRERVGGTVREWEDEREGGEVLGREKEGVERSWCGWCDRVVRGEKDVEGGGVWRS